ncbi:RDD family protein [Tetragenococcus koreensis]|uniref:RDD family protein n=2 Tax=Tetragenococcus koreensis TaxID=290335 RepID=A0AAN4UDB3_9ENTE|nr:RDD family protein [Tetragenococcus koreensis]AYW45107.1 RDD family protein [Tetragenococcus koreensis]MCF1584323.1 RDD family protein [Tetragenococcus koreensis]MCF1613872.1 RDD family protein [Tetragenococcus koreensis]MCF1616064.1 RDD family protein [Tetragenococcus koreensis]MCF1618584.1 RDD family protein [Tetragenococcus koreensis]
MSEQENETQQKGFYQKVLTSFKSEEYTENEIAQKKSDWQQYEEKPKKKRYINDFPNYFFAGFWIRLFAFIIDLLCINAMTSVVLDTTFTWMGMERATEFLSAYSLLALAIYLAYFTLLTKLNKGQTIGKMIFGIRVICLTEKKLTWKTVLIREMVGRFILQGNPLLYLGYLPAIFTNKKQHVADYFADTSVVTINLIQAFNQKANA